MIANKAAKTDRSRRWMRVVDSGVEVNVGKEVSTSNYVGKA